LNNFLKDKNLIEIDYSLCKGCGLCACVCMYEKFEIKSGKAKIRNIPCYICTHCYSVCPEKAIKVKKPDKISIEVSSHLQWLASIRSVRKFADKPVSKELLEEILNVARYSPTAKNVGEKYVTVLYSKEKIRTYINMIAGFYKRTMEAVNKVPEKLLGFTMKFLRIRDVNFPKLKESYKYMLEKLKKGEDPFFFNAPIVFVVHVPKSIVMYKENGLILSSYIVMAAGMSGLGACYSGYALLASKYMKKIKKFLKVPSKNEVIMVIAAGYPEVKFQRLPIRMPVKSIFL